MGRCILIEKVYFRIDEWSEKWSFLNYFLWLTNLLQNIIL